MKEEKGIKKRGILDDSSVVIRVRVLPIAIKRYGKRLEKLRLVNWQIVILIYRYEYWFIDNCVIL